MNSSDHNDWSWYNGSLDYVDSQLFSSVVSGSGQPVDTSTYFVAAPDTLDQSNWQHITEPTYATEQWLLNSQTPIHAEVATSPQGLAQPSAVSDSFVPAQDTIGQSAWPAWPAWIERTNEDLAPEDLAPAAVAPAAPVAAPAPSPQDVAPPAVALSAVAPAAVAPAAPVAAAAAPPQDVAPPAAATRSLKRKRGASPDPPDDNDNDNKRPNVNRLSSYATRVLVPPPRQDIMKTSFGGLPLLLADDSPIIATAKEMASKIGVRLPSSEFLSTFIRRHRITGSEFLTSGFWSLLLADGRHPHCIPKLAGLLKVVQAARSHSPAYKARVQAWTKAMRKPYDADRAHLFKLTPSDTLLRAISLVSGPVSYGEVKDVSFPGGSCKIRGAHRSRLVTWSPEPEIVMDDEG